MEMLREFVLSLFLHIVVISRGQADENQRVVSPEKCIVWGPGLVTDIILPARYFFIQAVDQYGKNFTESVGSSAFTLTFNLSDGGRYRASNDVIDRRDGSYIGRFRINWRHQDNLLLSIKYGSKHIAGSPYNLGGAILYEHCDCPEPDILNWFDTLGCANTYPQLEQDLDIFQSSLDFENVAKEAIQRFHGTISHYKIIDNQIYKRDYFGKNSITMGVYMNEILLSLARKVRLPDVEFIFNLSDWPREKRTATENPIPVASWCGSTDTRDIVLPTYEVIKSVIYMLERTNTDIFSVQGRTGPVWSNKSEKAYFRGRDSHKARLDLAILSQKHPDVIDAAMTRIARPPEDDRYGPLSKYVDFFSFFQHKYQINIDGTVAAFRLPFLLASDSVVFKQDSKYYEHYYTELVPYVHYIPVKENLDDLLDKISWAKEHDKETEAIGRASQQFVIDHLSPLDIYCYYAKFLHKFSKMLKTKPVMEEGFIKVEPRDNKKDSNCDCPRTRKTKHNHHTEL